VICIQEGRWPQRMVVAQETEEILMRKSQEENKKNAI
jgi:hypothetical protein